MGEVRGMVVEERTTRWIPMIPPTTTRWLQMVTPTTTRWIQMMTPTWLLLLKLMFPGIPTASGKGHRGRKIPLIPR